jgi:hypothetical protein
MSAVNVIRQAQRVDVLTDGGFDDGSNGLIFQGSKVWPLAHLHAVVAGRGPALMVPLFGQMLGGAARTYDELRKRALPAVRRYFAEQQEIWTRCASGTGFDLVIAGWSETIGPHAFAISNRAESEQDPWWLIEIAADLTAPSTPEIFAAIKRLIAGRHADEIDPEVDGLAIMEIQRESKVAGAPSVFAQLTTITADGITMRILRKWPEADGIAYIGEHACSPKPPAENGDVIRKTI